MNVERGLLSVLLWPIHRLVLRASRGQVGVREATGSGMGTLVLATTGRRTGARRDRPVYFMRDRDRFVVVASNVGDAQEPNWWRNLKANPEADVSVGESSVAVRAREATAEERARLWPELVRRNPAYERYARRTERQIPVVILEPRPTDRTRR